MLQTSGHGPVADPISVHGAGRLHPDTIRRLIREGHRCVRFEYCISVVAVTFRFRTAVCLTGSWQARYLYGLAYSLLALAFGPWGVPWGPILTVRAVWENLRGGEDVTAQLLSRLE